MSVPFDHRAVMFVDCQATQQDPQKGQLLEIAWQRNQPDPLIQSELVKPPLGFSLPEKTKQLTGIDRAELDKGDSIASIWNRFYQQVKQIPHTTLVAHYSRFEGAVFRHIHQQLQLPECVGLAFICTYEIARRLFPGLPAHSLRSVAGFLGASVENRRRAHIHVAATRTIWEHCWAQLNARYGICTIAELQDWIETEKPKTTRKKSFRISQAQRTLLPNTPGVYYFHDNNQQILYIGKATSLRQRVSQHFTNLRAAPKKNREMLSQAWRISTMQTTTPIEAALHEVDEIHRVKPAYNQALRFASNQLWYATNDFTSVTDQPDPTHRLGPFVGPDLIGSFRDLVRTFQTENNPQETSGPGQTLFLSKQEWQSVQDQIISRFGKPGPHQPIAPWLLRLARKNKRHENEQDEAWQRVTDYLGTLKKAIRRGWWISHMGGVMRVFFRETGSRQGRLLVFRQWCLYRSLSQTTAHDIQPIDRPSSVCRLDRLGYTRMRVLLTELSHFRKLHPTGEVVLGLDKPSILLTGNRLDNVLGGL